MLDLGVDEETVSKATELSLDDLQFWRQHYLDEQNRESS
jgi:hypothetical protein